MNCKIIILSLMLLLPCGVARAETPKTVLAIIGEAENSKDGMAWVACVIKNRGGSLRGVYGHKSKRVLNRLYSSKVFAQAVQAYEEAKKRDLTGGCEFWFSNADLKQNNVKRIIRLEKLVFVKNVGGNNFYKRGAN